MVVPLGDMNCVVGVKRMDPPLARIFSIHRCADRRFESATLDSDPTSKGKIIDGRATIAKHDKTAI